VPQSVLLGLPRRFCFVRVLDGVAFAREYMNVSRMAVEVVVAECKALD
jgi:hypothetical protein